MIIYLGTSLLTHSSSLPESQTRRTITWQWRTVAFPSVWPCSGWGLPSHCSHLQCWWALTPPFHPYLPTATEATTRRRSILCCTFPSLAAGRRYRPSCSVEPGLSSRGSLHQRSPDQLGISIVVAQSAFSNLGFTENERSSKFHAPSLAKQKHDDQQRVNKHRKDKRCKEKLNGPKNNNRSKLEQPTRNRFDGLID